MAENVQKAVEAAVVDAMQTVERQLDGHLHQMDNVDDMQDDQLEAIRQKRLNQLKKQAEDRARWRRNGHGTVHRVPEKEFFSRSKGIPRMVAIFFRPGSSRYTEDFLEHITLIAQAHLETLFITIDAEKAPFLCDRLRIRVMPSLVLVKDGEIDQMLPGLDHLCSQNGAFSTNTIEKRLFNLAMLTDTNISDNA